MGLECPNRSPSERRRRKESEMQLTCGKCWSSKHMSVTSTVPSLASCPLRSLSWGRWTYLHQFWLSAKTTKLWVYGDSFFKEQGLFSEENPSKLVSTVQAEQVQNNLCPLNTQLRTPQNRPTHVALMEILGTIWTWTWMWTCSQHQLRGKVLIRSSWCRQTIRQVSIAAAVLQCTLGVFSFLFGYWLFCLVPAIFRDQKS